MQKVYFTTDLFIDDNYFSYEFKNKKQMLQFNRQVTKHLSDAIIDNTIYFTDIDTIKKVQYDIKTDTFIKVTNHINDSKFTDTYNFIFLDDTKFFNDTYTVVD